MTVAALSETATGKMWIKNFEKTERRFAKTFLDALILYNEEEVAYSIRNQLEALAAERKGKRRRVALYAEREIQENLAFEVEILPSSNGKKKERAVGRKGRAPVKPIRGGVRVGSEGPVANLIAQAVASNGEIFVNTPGPDRIRSKSRPISTIAIVSDFIGSGRRISSMLDKFWAVKTVRSWVSTGLVDFTVIAAVGTIEGVAEVEHHVTRPIVRTQHTAPTLDSPLFEKSQASWEALIDKVGLPNDEDEYQFGFADSAAMALFNYKIPNNAPSILWKGVGAIKPLYQGAAPDDLRELFWATAKSERVARAARDRGLLLDQESDPEEQLMFLVLQEIRGRFKRGTIRRLAEQLTLSEPEISFALSDALGRQLLDMDGRLTDLGYRTLDANNINREKKVMVPTNPNPYYPVVLRSPKGSSSTSRTKVRP